MMQIQLVQNVSGAAGVAGDGALLREDISIFHDIDMLSIASTTTTSSDSGNASVQTVIDTSVTHSHGPSGTAKQKVKKRDVAGARGRQFQHSWLKLYN